MTHGVKRKASDIDKQKQNKKDLMKKTMSTLMDIAAAENVVLPVQPSRVLKIHVVEAIYNARNPGRPAADETSVAVPDEEEEEEVTTMDVDVVAVTEDDGSAHREREELTKKLIAVSTIAELKMIVIKENIVMRPGRKVHKDYVNAIYLSRHPPNK